MSRAKPATPSRRALYEQWAAIGRAIANPSRLELLELLTQGPRSVEVLARQASLGVPNTSQQLRTLREAGLVSAVKRGLFVTYRLEDEGVARLLQSVGALAERRVRNLAAVADAFADKREGWEPVDRKKLWERIRRGAVTVLDVRPRKEYLAGHLAGAISIPIPELRRRWVELPKTKEVVAYCRGQYCVMAVEAVELLRAKGYQAWRLEEGVREFREMGWKIAVQ